jgi:hypothetical protein
MLEGIWYSMNYKDDYLAHYGIIGMKWGQRRVRVNQAKAGRAKKLGNKEAYSKYSSKANRIKQRHVRLSGGKKAYNYTKNESLGKSLVKAVLFTRYGAMKYNEFRSNGESQMKSGVKAVTYGFANNATGNLLISTVEPRLRN